MKENGTLEAEDQFEEWFQETDLGTLPGAEQGVLLDASERIGRPRIGKKISLTLPEELIDKLKREAQKKGIGYQTYARMILMEKMTDKKPWPH